MENKEEVEQKFDKKTGKKGLVICIASVVVLALVVALCCTYFVLNSKPKAILKSYVNKLASQEYNKKVETCSADFKMSAKLNTTNADMQAVFDEIAKCTIEFGAQMNVKSEEEIAKIALKYDNQDALSLDTIYKEKAIYLYLDGIFEKYIKVEMDEEAQKSLNDIFDMLKSSDLNKDSQEVWNSIKDVLIEKIENSENIEQEKVTVKVGEKDKKVTKTSIKLSSKELSEMGSKMLLKLSEANVYAKNEEVKTNLKDLAEMLKTAEVSENDYAKVALYTEGLNNKFVQIDVEIYTEEMNASFVIMLQKTAKDSYKYDVSMNGQGVTASFASGEIKIEKEISKKTHEKAKVVLTAEIPETVTQAEAIKAEITVESDIKINSDTDNVDVSNCVKLEELTQDDYSAIMEKLSQRPLIGNIITMLMSVSGF